MKSTPLPQLSIVRDRLLSEVALLRARAELESENFRLGILAERPDGIIDMIRDCEPDLAIVGAIDLCDWRPDALRTRFELGDESVVMSISRA